MNRRDFLRLSACLTCGFSALIYANYPSPILDDASEEGHFITDARHYTRLAHKKIRCDLCPRQCVVDDQERGYCGVRENRGGIYKTLVYGRACALHIDPIEKKPLFHFLPGTQALSLATAGCNVNCKFCQNWEISQVRPEDISASYFPPIKLIEIARERSIPTIAYTYTEPVVFYEYMYDTASQGQNGTPRIRSVMISGGYIRQKPLLELLNVLDAVKIDLKAYTEDFYRNYVNGELKPILETLRVLHQEKKWFEIVYLVIPTLNDSKDSIRDMCTWILDTLGPDVPLHFTRFYPQYLIQNLPATPISTLERSREIGLQAGLNYVYIGNVPGHHGENTYCHFCGKMVIQRYGYMIQSMELKNGNCSFCGQHIPGVWN